MKTVYKVTTNCCRTFLVVATSPGRAITKLHRRGRKLLDRGERATSVTEVGTIDVE